MVSLDGEIHQIMELGIPFGLYASNLESKYAKPREALAKLQQRGSVQDYQKEFKCPANLTVEPPGLFMIKYFVSNL